MIRKSLFLVVLAIILAIAANPILAKRPNIILILTDDQDKEPIEDSIGPKTFTWGISKNPTTNTIWNGP